MTTLARARLRPTRAAAPTPALEGIVTAIVAVTGHEDSVQDIIVPGSFADTLRRIRPKLCWHHQWTDPLGRVLHIVEVKPGDKRLPKTLPDGRAWPKEAGAVIATMQFNLRTTRGRDMFEHCKLWAENGEAAFSIGYKVREGESSKRADGVRLIYGLDLYEVSLVLHGAHNMALALEVKDASGITGLEFKDTPTGVTEVKSAEPMIGEGAMVALYLPSEAAGALVVPDGNPADELHVTLAFLGGKDEADAITDPHAVAVQLAAAVAGSGELTGHLGGIGVFPASGDSGTPVWVPVDVPGLIELRQKVVAALNQAGFPQKSEHGYTPHVTLGYDLPSLEPVDSTPVTFGEVVLVVGGRRYPIPLNGNPIEGKAAAAVTEARTILSRLEGKTALNAVLEAKTMFGGAAGAATVQSLGVPQKVAGANTKKRPKRTPQEGIETKMMSQMKGSHEERRDALRNALEKLLIPERHKTPSPDGIVSEDCGWLSIEATFDDYVLASVEKKGETTSYSVPWSVGADNDEIGLGKPTKVELSVVAIPEGEGEPAAVETGEAVTMRFLDPASVQLADATARLRAMPALEGKDAWGEDFTNSLLELMDALSVKGFDVAHAVLGADEEDPEEGADEPPVDLEEVPDDPDDPEGLNALDTDDEPVEEDDAESVNPSKDTVTLDADAVRAQLAELRA